MLRGSELRNFDNKLRNQGIHREIERALGRGDSPTMINKMFKSAGYNLNRFQTLDYIAKSYSSKIATAYYDKLAARFGTRSKVNVAAFEQAGYRGKINLTLEARTKWGEVVYKTHRIEGAEYENIRDLIKDFGKDTGDIEEKYELEEGSVQVIGLGFL